ncbi:MAG: HNH endonuclease [Alphaproteobacteria bacterium]
MSQSRKRPVIHRSIKERLGYDLGQPDKDVYADWTERLGRVCKPCWELKYCPFGPLVEQSPLLPPERGDMIEHTSYLKQAVERNELGGIEALDEERRAFLEEWIQDEQVLVEQVRHEMAREALDTRIAASPDPGKAFDEVFVGPLPSIEQYRVPYDVIGRDFDPSTLPEDERKEFLRRVAEHKAEMQKAIDTGVEDTRRPLDPGRMASFIEEIERFDPEDYPPEIPEVFTDGACSIFGHICPVFFSAEATTESSTERRKGRYIPFATKMRVVRRDNHTCQHCGKHLRDDEVEFDHIIPLARGGNSEEHNVRLTCFDCNRGKSDSYQP